MIIFKVRHRENVVTGRLLLQLKEGYTEMVVYKLYGCDQKEEPHLVGILPERRKKQERISEESVLNWGKQVIGENSDFNDIYFVQTEM